MLNLGFVGLERGHFGRRTQWGLTKVWSRRKAGKGMLLVCALLLISTGLPFLNGGYFEVLRDLISSLSHSLLKPVCYSLKSGNN